LSHEAIFTEGLLNANLCAPTMTLQQGNDFYIDLNNVGMLMRPDLFDPHTVHFHGFPQAASVFDGEPMASFGINMGGTLRYAYRLVMPGTYFYHCHVEATEHMQMGMIGNLWVNPRQNYTGYGANTAATRARLAGNTNAAAALGYVYNDGDGSTAYDVEAPIQITGFDRFFHEQHIAVQPLPFSTLHDDYPMINGRGYPDTVNTNEFVNSVGKTNQKINALVRAKVGQRVLLRISCVSESDYYTVSVPGIPMRVIAKDARMLRTANIGNPNTSANGSLGETASPTGANLSYRTMSVSLGGGETSDVILDTAGITPGTYVLYTTRANFLSNGPEDFGGLMTEIILEP
jgi:FtsP/CotA-like multicopper oxidase with cupredoxin domain